MSLDLARRETRSWDRVQYSDPQIGTRLDRTSQCHGEFVPCDTEASPAYRRRPTVRVMKEGPSGSAIMS
jgi:hypothetical protein